MIAIVSFAADGVILVGISFILFVTAAVISGLELWRGRKENHDG